MQMKGNCCSASFRFGNLSNGWPNLLSVSRMRIVVIRGMKVISEEEVRTIAFDSGPSYRSSSSVINSAHLVSLPLLG